MAKAFYQMGLKYAQFKLPITVKGSIILLVVLGDGVQTTTSMVDFLVFDHLTAYSAIFGKPSIRMKKWKRLIGKDQKALPLPPACCMSHSHIAAEVNIIGKVGIDLEGLEAKPKNEILKVQLAEASKPIHLYRNDPKKVTQIVLVFLPKKMKAWNLC
ncbi:hypothetical protein GOBAR_AA04429 [Gossypium barbadense]|uniref:Uncharacterized protein n=1 Tax=Gossypium barbadense TaxID=3634 RepID=A0A2P5YKP0_GOSBA|nr:hypothetical protein GOBAR_AA04429 [Gossypium barbadense]